MTLVKTMLQAGFLAAAMGLLQASPAAALTIVPTAALTVIPIKRRRAGAVLVSAPAVAAISGLFEPAPAAPRMCGRQRTPLLVFIRVAETAPAAAVENAGPPILRLPAFPPPSRRAVPPAARGVAIPLLLGGGGVASEPLTPTLTLVQPR